MSIIELKDFSKDYGEKSLFINTSFTLNEGEKVFLTGLNGAGKSTLLKVLVGEVLLDKGTLTINKKYTIRYLDQHANIDKTLTIKQYLCKAYQHLYDVEAKINEINMQLATENNPTKVEKLMFKSGDLYEFLEANNFYEIDSNVEKVCAGLGVKAMGLDTTIATLSGGQRAKLLLLQMSMSGSDVLILDEPTRNFSPLSNPVIRQMLKGFGGVILSISHDRKYMEEVADRVYELTEKGLELIRE